MVSLARAERWAGPVVVGDTVFTPSGDVGVKNGMPGNVLLAVGAE